jgi:hypothetical protein
LSLVCPGLAAPSREASRPGPSAIARRRATESTGALVAQPRAAASVRGFGSERPSRGRLPAPRARLASVRRDGRARDHATKGAGELVRQQTRMRSPGRVARWRGLRAHRAPRAFEKRLAAFPQRALPSAGRAFDVGEARRAIARAGGAACRRASARAEDAGGEMESTAVVGRSRLRCGAQPRAPPVPRARLASARRDGPIGGSRGSEITV